MIRKTLTRIYMTTMPAIVTVSFAITGQPVWLVALMAVVALPPALLLFLPED